MGAESWVRPVLNGLSLSPSHPKPVLPAKAGDGLWLLPTEVRLLVKFSFAPGVTSFLLSQLDPVRKDLLK